MNTLSAFIERLEAEPYYFAGSYWTADVLAAHPMLFEFDCEFTHTDSEVSVEGVYRAHFWCATAPLRAQASL